MNTDADWREAIERSPDDRSLLLAYGDWLEERGELLRAFRARQRAGAGKVVLCVWHPSWGQETVGDFAELQHLRLHVLMKTQGRKAYQGPRGTKPVPADELVVAVTWRTSPLEIERHALTPELEI
jgi:uncharacterized protein (TIGR02996 family)